MNSIGNADSAARIWPCAIAATSGLGLVVALIGDGAWDVFSWAMLAIPVAITALAWRRALR